MKKIIISLLLTFCLMPSIAQSKGSYVLYDYSASDYIVRFNHKEIRSIASITKLFTAYTVVRSGVDLEEKIKVNGRSGGRVPAGAYISRIDLLRAMMISSDNRAAETLANHHPGGFSKFISDVNEHAIDNLLYDTRIVDSTGLLAGNTSTAFDLVHFLSVVQNHPVIRKISAEQNAVLRVPKGKKVLIITLKNTNPEMFTYDNILISKTGFTNPAGRCVLMLIEKDKDRYAVVVLGQQSVASRSTIVNTLMHEDTGHKPEPKINSTVEYEIGLGL